MSDLNKNLNTEPSAQEKQTLFPGAYRQAEDKGESADQEQEPLQGAKVNEADLSADTEENDCDNDDSLSVSA